jgi:hypothetical protein
MSDTQLDRIEDKLDELLDIFRQLDGLATKLSKNPMLSGFLGKI